MDQFHRAMSQNPCLPCILAKKNKLKIQHSEQTELTNLEEGELISGYIIGKIQPPTRYGDWTVRDFYTRVPDWYSEPYQSSPPVQSGPSDWTGLVD